MTHILGGEVAGKCRTKTSCERFLGARAYRRVKTKKPLDYFDPKDQEIRYDNIMYSGLQWVIYGYLWVLWYRFYVEIVERASLFTFRVRFTVVYINFSLLL